MARQGTNREWEVAVMAEDYLAEKLFDLNAALRNAAKAAEQIGDVENGNDYWQLGELLQRAVERAQITVATATVTAYEREYAEVQ